MVHRRGTSYRLIATPGLSATSKQERSILPNQGNLFITQYQQQESVAAISQLLTVNIPIVNSHFLRIRPGNTTITDQTNKWHMRGSREFCQRGSIFVNFFFLSWWGEGGSKYHYKWVIISPPAKRHLNGVSLACRWWPNIECWLENSVTFRGSGQVLLRNPIFLWFSGGGGGGGSGPPVPLLDPHMRHHEEEKLEHKDTCTLALPKPERIHNTIPQNQDQTQKPHTHNIIIRFLINMQVQGHHPHQCPPFQVTGYIAAGIADLTPDLQVLLSWGLLWASTHSSLFPVSLGLPISPTLQ